MSTNDTSIPTPEILTTLREETDAVRLIAERLQVKQMGPADHIRTKHEIKAFVESGDLRDANELIRRARIRYELNQSATIRQSQRRSERMTD